MFALIPGCLVFMGLFIWLQRKNCAVPALFMKGLASLCFVTLGILCNAGAESGKPIVLGLILGCIADVLLGLRAVFVKRKIVFFLAGVLAVRKDHGRQSAQGLRRRLFRHLRALMLRGGKQRGDSAV